MFSVLDKEVNEYLHSGRNSKTKEECIDDALEFFLYGDTGTEWDMDEVVKKIGKEKFLMWHHFVIVEHDARIEDDEYEN